MTTTNITSPALQEDIFSFTVVLPPTQDRQTALQQIRRLGQLSRVDVVTCKRCLGHLKAFPEKVENLLRLAGHKVARNAASNLRALAAMADRFAENTGHDLAS